MLNFIYKKDLYFDTIIITKDPGFSPGKSAPKVKAELST